MKRLRLVKVVVHPIFVVDDGKGLAEFRNSASEVPAHEWAAFPARLARDMKAAEKALNAPAPEPAKRPKRTRPKP